MPIKLNAATGGGSVALSAPNSTTSNADVTLTLPPNDGDASQYLQTDGSGALSWQTVASLSNAEDGTGTNFEFNSGFGSNGVAYGVRAWVNFQGTGTVDIRADGNVSSITDNGTGVYRINFTTAMPDDDYSVVGSNIGSVHASYATFVCADNALNATGSCDIELRNVTGSIVDQPSVNIIVCR